MPSSWIAPPTAPASGCQTGSPTSVPLHNAVLSQATSPSVSSNSQQATQRRIEHRAPTHIASGRPGPSYRPCRRRRGSGRCRTANRPCPSCPVMIWTSSPSTFPSPLRSTMGSIDTCQMSVEPCPPPRAEDEIQRAAVRGEFGIAVPAAGVDRRAEIHRGAPRILRRSFAWPPRCQRTVFRRRDSG